MKALVINDTRSHYGFVIEVERNRDGSYYDSITDLVYEARELQFQWEEKPTPVDWDAFRREAAKDLLCALIEARKPVTFQPVLIGDALRYTNALIEQLKQE